MEMELDPRVKPLPYKIEAMLRETSAQKAINVLDADLRNYWSTATNTKEWILLELEEPCLLSHIRIHNKSVLEWEVTAGLRYKPFVQLVACSALMIRSHSGLNLLFAKPCPRLFQHCPHQCSIHFFMDTIWLKGVK